MITKLKWINKLAIALVCTTMVQTEISCMFGWLADRAKNVVGAALTYAAALPISTRIEVSADSANKIHDAMLARDSDDAVRVEVVEEPVAPCAADIIPAAQEPAAPVTDTIIFAPSTDPAVGLPAAELSAAMPSTSADAPRPIAVASTSTAPTAIPSAPVESSSSGWGQRISNALGRKAEEALAPVLTAQVENIAARLEQKAQALGQRAQTAFGQAMGQVAQELRDVLNDTGKRAQEALAPVLTAQVENIAARLEQKAQALEQRAQTAFGQAMGQVAQELRDALSDAGRKIAQEALVPALSEQVENITTRLEQRAQNFEQRAQAAFGQIAQEIRGAREEARTALGGFTQEIRGARDEIATTLKESSQSGFGQICALFKDHLSWLAPAGTLITSLLGGLATWLFAKKLKLGKGSTATLSGTCALLPLCIWGMMKMSQNTQRAG